MDEKIIKLAQIINESNNIVFFGGAGVSTESKIPDFRSEKGIFKENTSIPPEEIISHSFFVRNPQYFYDFYKTKMIYLDAKPNDAHLALTKLEKMGKLKAIITQNIDSLHQLSGSKEVLELHGSVMRNYCQECHKFFDVSYIIGTKGVPHCDACGGIIKPDVILYEEELNMNILEKALEYITKADVLIVGGTSLMVYPAASLVRYFSGKELVIINKTTTGIEKNATLVINDSVGKVFSEVMAIVEGKNYE
ncbi:MAG: NAD-dependent protein deacylase [Bacilli bacterium]|nr:NAD-dependent protein deacylase [Bacilli bacterium]